MQLLQEFENAQLKKTLPRFKAGDTVKVHCKIKEGDKERIQIFEGVVLGRHNKGLSSSFTVRKISFGMGVERIFPLHAPFVDKIEVMTRGKVRRSKLYYLKKLSGKKARITAEDTRGFKTKAELAKAEEAKRSGVTVEAGSPEASAKEKSTEEAPKGEEKSSKETPKKK